MMLKFILIVFLTSLAPVWARDRAEAVPEHAMKAVYLYNFAQLTTWPARAGGSEIDFNLCVFEENELGNTLNGLRGRMIGQQPLRVFRVNDLSAARQCHILYVGEYELERAGNLLRALHGSPVLTVSEASGPTQAGAMLMMSMEGRRLAFEVNIELAERANLKFSSKLLSLAKKVYKQ